MNVLVVGFITIDQIELQVRTITSVGGPPCYAGLLLSRFGLDVSAATRIGVDFPNEQVVWLSRNGLQLRGADRSATKKTTRFKIALKGDVRSLSMTERCDDIGEGQVPERHYDAAIISPLANEVSQGVIDVVRKRSDFCFLDPQGFVRKFDRAGAVSVESWDDAAVLAAADAVKVDMEEARAITGKTDPKAALSALYERGLRKAILTQGSEAAYVLDGFRLFRVGVPKVKVVDTTGAGDILSASVTTCYLRTRDFLWSCCFGVAASSLSLDAIALAKVDLPRTVDQQAKVLYSTAVPVGSALG